MNKFIIVTIGLLVLLVVGGTSSYFDYQEPINQSFDGQVTHIDWKSRNHGMPLILLKRENGLEQKLHSSRIALTSAELKVGDMLLKKSGSNECVINGKSVTCIN